MSNRTEAYYRKTRLLHRSTRLADAHVLPHRRVARNRLFRMADVGGRERVGGRRARAHDASAVNHIYGVVRSRVCDRA